ncbi:MAG: tetratricopeptide repeat protein [Thermomicrobiales bacterium]|nr:tetratricopeptide repeat protein [Thermomicrobiales bacterium]MCO5220518.1 tetratricopeptide repeat protein [Thermomicrobiales bacterium]
MTRIGKLIGGRSRGEGNCEAIFQIAREVVERRRSMQGALNEVRHPAILDNLSDEDFRLLDEAIVESAPEYPEYAMVLARLTHAAARAKGFDRQIVDSALRLDSFLPADDPSREREQLLRDAYTIAQRAGYARGGRATLSRLGVRALDADEFDRARAIFQQQMDIGDESTDTIAEVDSALMLGDILRREGDVAGAQTYYRRAARSAARIEYHRGVAEALDRQIELMDGRTDAETAIQLQREALDAAMLTPDLGLQSRLTLALAETLAQAGRVDEVIEQLEHGVDIAREIGDLSVEAECLQALVEAYRNQGNLIGVAKRQTDLLLLEERMGNRPVAARWGVRLGATLMELNKPQRAVEAYSRAQQLARSLNDPMLDQRILGGLGVAYTQLERPAEALEYLMEANEIAKEMGDLPKQAEWLASIGQALSTFDQPKDAIAALGESLAIARRIDDVPMQIDLLTLMGEIFDAAGQLPRSRECFHRALDLARRMGDKDRQIRLNSSLGSVALRAQQHAQANALYSQAFQLATETGNRVEGAKLQGRLGKVAQQQRDWPKALEHYYSAVDLAESIDKPRLTNQLLVHLAAAQHAVGDPAAAGTYRRALTLSQQVGDVYREAVVRLNLGMLLSADGHRNEGLDQLYRAADLVADMGPAGSDLAASIEEAIMRAGGSVVASPSDADVWDDRQSGLSRGFPRGYEYQPYENDQFYGEGSLPPR